MSHTIIFSTPLRSGINNYVCRNSNTFLISSYKNIKLSSHRNFSYSNSIHLGNPLGLNQEKLNSIGLTSQYSNSTILNNSWLSKKLYSVKSTSHKNCWKCNTKNASNAIFCLNEKCGIVQKLDKSTDYFSILNTNKTFDVDLKNIKQNFLKLQQIVHPDNFSQKSMKEKQYSEIQSSFINKAYHTLINPLERSIYMLEMNGINLGEHESVNNKEFLMEVMEINEAIEDSEDQEEIDDINDENQDRIEQSIKIISDSYKSNDLEKVKVETIKLRYWTNIQNTIKEWNPPKKQ